jgi:hypothetical protein
VADTVFVGLGLGVGEPLDVGFLAVGLVKEHS